MEAEAGRLSEILTIRIALGRLSLRGNESVGVENIGLGVYFGVMEIMPGMICVSLCPYTEVFRWYHYQMLAKTVDPFGMKCPS